MLDELRKGIDEIADQMVELLGKRLDFVKQIGELKRNSNATIYRPERETNAFLRGSPSPM